MAGLDVLELILYRMEFSGEVLSVPDLKQRCVSMQDEVLLESP
jgi:hypothetical protein